MKKLNEIKIQKYNDKYKQKIIDFLINIAVNEFGFKDWLLYLKNKDFEPYKLNSSIFYFIEKNNKIIATCAAWKKDEKIIKLNSFYVDKNYRNQGIGKLLFEKTIQFAKQNNYKQIILCAHQQNEVAIKFYEKENFVIDRVEDNGEIWYKLNI